MSDIGDGPAQPVGLREQKRKETLRRITDAGIRLFGMKGYEATTLEDIAAEAGISRRTFFHYFKSKDDILLSMQRGLGEHLVAALQAQKSDKPPFAAMRDAMLGLVSNYSREELLEVDRLMRSSEAVQARKQANYLQDEQMVFAAMRALWPNENSASLRALAMVAIGTSRLSLDTWSSENGRRPLPEVLAETFDALAIVSPRH
jgi:AcrR family transcriptional regulator